MAKGKIQHWKHGWIPLTAYARAIVAGKKNRSTPVGFADPVKPQSAARARASMDIGQRARQWSPAAHPSTFGPKVAPPAFPKPIHDLPLLSRQSLMLKAPAPKVPADALMNALKTDGGFTYDPKKGTIVKVGTVEGVAVARPGTEEIVGAGDVGREDFANAVANVIEKHGEVLGKGAMLGGWYSEDRDRYMVEVTDVFPDRDSAVQAGVDRNQEGVFDLKTGDYIPTGGTGDGKLMLTDNPQSAVLGRDVVDPIPSSESSFSAAADNAAELVFPSLGPGQPFWPEGVPAIKDVGVFNAKDGARLADAWAVAGPLLDSYTDLEPDITPGLVNAAAMNHGYMLGLENRLKTRDSLTRKLYSKSLQKKLTPAEYGAKLGDTLRYTMVTPDADLAKGTQSVIDSYRKRGYTVAVENTWGDPDATYRGINTNFIAPDGRIFEVQFHTQQSFDVKTEQHGLYDVARSNTSTPEQVTAANAQMMANMKTLAFPPGITSVK